MSGCRECHGLFVGALYGELSDDQKRRFEDHLHSCRECSRAFAEYQSVLGIMGQRRRDMPDEAFWESFWPRLAARLKHTAPVAEPLRQRWRHWLRHVQPMPAWSLRLAAAVALVGLGLLLGRVYFGAPPSTTSEWTRKGSASRTEAQPASAVELRAQRYIERSKVLLLGLVNFDPKTEDPAVLDLRRQQQVSRVLVREAAVLKSELSGPDQQRLRRLVEDLEVILLQIAGMESRYDLPAIDLVKSGVDRRAILLKINLEEMQRMGSQDSTRRRPASKPNI